MVFSSLTFLFLFFFVTVVAYFAVPNRIWRNGVLLLASLFFYAWGEPYYVLIMILATGVAYAGGLLLDRIKRDSGRRAVLTVTVCLLVLNLLVFKYLNFFADNLGILIGKDLEIRTIALPIGISFYTFQILSYVIDLYRGKVSVQRNFLRLLLYVSFFPQLIAGPIVRYQTVEQEISCRSESLDDALWGSKRFLRGLGKKVILANGVAQVADMIYAVDPALGGSALYWVGAVAYAMQIYFDFSGYSDMAIGMGRIFGFHFLENFNHPYRATSITEFWRRWHISLSSWFRDYVYIPLGGNRVSRSRWVLNLLIVWALTGFWHGAQWNFILWGLYYGLLLWFEKRLGGKWLSKLPLILQWLVTMFFVVLGWVLFNLTDFSQMTAVLKVMFSLRKTNWLNIVANEGRLVMGMIYLPLGVICLLPWEKLLPCRSGTGWQILSYAFHLALLAISIVLLISSQFNPFIYFRF